MSKQITPEATPNKYSPEIWNSAQERLSNALIPFTAKFRVDLLRAELEKVEGIAGAEAEIEQLESTLLEALRAMPTKYKAMLQAFAQTGYSNTQAGTNWPDRIANLLTTDELEAALNMPELADFKRVYELANVYD